MVHKGQWSDRTLQTSCWYNIVDLWQIQWSYLIFNLRCYSWHICFVYVLSIIYIQTYLQKKLYLNNVWSICIRNIKKKIIRNIIIQILAEYEFVFVFECFSFKSCYIFISNIYKSTHIQRQIRRMCVSHITIQCVNKTAHKINDNVHTLCFCTYTKKVLTINYELHSTIRPCCIHYLSANLHT